jgi:hypothetical protein
MSAAMMMTARAVKAVVNCTVALVMMMMITAMVVANVTMSLVKTTIQSVLLANCVRAAGAVLTFMKIVITIQIVVANCAKHHGMSALNVKLIMTAMSVSSAYLDNHTILDGVLASCLVQMKHTAKAIIVSRIVNKMAICAIGLGLPLYQIAS